MKEFLNLFKRLTSNGIHVIAKHLDLLFNALTQVRKRRKERVLHKVCRNTLGGVIILILFIDFGYVKFS